MTQHRATKILIAYVHDRPGVLTKIASTFYRRGMNIITLTVGHTCTPDVSKIVLRVSGDAYELNRLLLSVNNLVDVISVDIKDDNVATARELCLVRMATPQHENDDAMLDTLLRFEARILERTPTSIVVEMVDAPTRIDAFLESLASFRVIDLSRTGATAIPSSNRVVQAPDSQMPWVREVLATVERHLKQEVEL